MRLLTGGYTADMKGSASGLGTLLAGAADDGLAGGPLSFVGDAVATDGSPSWIARHPTLDVVYASLEAAGAVRAFARTGEASFTPLGDQVPAGELVCHVAVAPDGRSLVASCWGDGRVVRMALDAAGRPSTPTIAEPATDPYDPDAVLGSAGAGEGADLARALGGQLFTRGVDAGEQGEEEHGEDDRVSRAHEAMFLPDGLLATTDLGFDLVRFWRPTADGLRPVGEVVLPRGTGPRHMLMHPSGHLYVITELSCEVFVLAREESGAWRLVGGTPVNAGTLDGDAAAELAMSRDGSFLYAGVRGSNTLGTLRVRDDGSALEPVALIESGVDWPRYHMVARDTLLVAGQHSNDVASLTLDERTGVPGRVRHRADVPSPTCLLPLP
jgi:6-phosphogluconolactonase (cycloisomerase 2 family)